MSSRPYHVHVYKVIELTEIDLHAEDEENARRSALELVETVKLKRSKPDCKHIAIAFVGKGT